MQKKISVFACAEKLKYCEINMLNLINKFVDLYLLPYVPNPNVNKFIVHIETELSSKITGEFIKDHKKEIMEDTGESMDKIDIMFYHDIKEYKLSSNKLKYQRFIINSPKKLNYVLPTYYEMFRSLYSNGTALKNINNHEYDTIKFVDILTGLCVDENAMEWKMPYDVYFVDEWLNILCEYDIGPLSHNWIYLNCCPMSKYYSKLLFVVSEIDGKGQLANFNFNEFIKIMVDRYEDIIEYANITGTFSIVEWFCNFYLKKKTNKLFFCKKNNNQQLFEKTT